MNKAEAERLCVEAIIDAELDAAQLAQEAFKAGASPAERIGVMARRVLNLVGRGPSSEAILTKLREGFEALALLEYAALVSRIAEHTEVALTKEHKAIEQLNSLGGSVAELPMVRNIDMKNRAMERAGALNQKGKVDGGE